MGLGGNRASHGLTPLATVRILIDKLAEGILNYLMHPITNAGAEGINSAIQSLKHAHRGLLGCESFRNRVVCFLAKLDLKPIQFPSPLSPAAPKKSPSNEEDRLCLGRL